MLERERQKRLTKQRYKPFCNIINEENNPDNTENSLKMTIRNHKNVRTGKSGFVSNSRGTNTMLESSSTHTKSNLNLTNEDVIVDKKKARQVVSKKICTDEIYGVKILQETAQSTENIWKPNSLACIEEKLDNLIHSINSFIVEMKTKTYPRLNNIDLPIKLGKANVNITKSDSYGIGKRERIVCGLVDSSSQSTRYSSKVSSDRFKHMDENIMKMNDILLKEIGRNKVSILKDTSVGDTYYPCSVQISVTIPTKEMSTEVTRSLSKAKYNSGNNIDVIEEIDPSIGKNRRMAIAVNTDPLSLLALLKVSTEETLRRLLSYVPSIDYYYYLSRLQSSQSRAIESPFICNICGAAFMKPSELSDHIQKHALGKTRDCCVCRHVLDMPRRRSGLFKCQYCGQRFTRAYCCELHQQSCARRLGMPHDIASSLMLLR
ncbi:uncharacterized protein [Epargyreus clarus]|uniref:uncharacterized protein n=1 Tax=Epargyreus clarus TaxID=520877 RepID=UPI003C2C3450